MHSALDEGIAKKIRTLNDKCINGHSGKIATDFETGLNYSSSSPYILG